MKSVLVPIDGSACSLQAVRYLIAARAEGIRPTIHLLNVQPQMTGDVSTFVARADIDGYRREQNEQALRGARTLLQEAAIPYEVHADVGHAADRIVRSAERLGCDHIVMGSPTRGALAELVVGSTAVKVLHQSRLPVLFVK